MTVADVIREQRWEAHAGYDVGAFLNRYLREHPAPPGSALARHLETSAALLEDAGRRELERLGHRRLRAVGGRS